MRDIFVTYSNFSNIFGVVPVYYQEQNNGTYTLWAVTDDFFITANVISSSDITDFVTNYKPSSILIDGGADDARLLGALGNTITLIAPRTSTGSLATAGSNPAGTAPNANPVLIGSWDGYNVRTVRSDTFGNPIYTDINYAAAFGLLPGVNAGTSNGYLPTSSTGTAAVRATTYTQPVAAAQRSITSSSASDTSAGTGARSVLITYYDGSMVGPKTTTVTLSGTTPVATSVSDIRFVEKMEVITVGSGGANVGTITLFVNNAGGGGTIGTIAVSDNSTFWAHHYVPTGKTCYLLAVRAGATVTNGAVTMQAAGSQLASNLAQKNLSGSIRYGSANQVVSFYEWTIPITITGPNFIFLTARADAATASTTSASFDYLEF